MSVVVLVLAWPRRPDTAVTGTWAVSYTHLDVYKRQELHLTQSELVRRVLYGVNVKHTVVVAQGGEDALAALAALSAPVSYTHLDVYKRQIHKQLALFG